MPVKIIVREEASPMIRSAPFRRLFPLIAVTILWSIPGMARAQQSAEIALIPGDLDAWISPHGRWEFVREVSLQPDNPKRFEAETGPGDVLYNGPTGRTPNLLTREKFGDVALHVEFTVPKGSNSGVKLHGVYEIQIADSWGRDVPTASDCGGVYPRAELLPRYHHIDGGYPPRVNASRAPGEWQTLDLVFQAPRFDAEGHKTANARFVNVTLNGQVVHEDRELPFPTGNNWHKKEVAVGPILLQGDHGPVAFRNIRVQPLALATSQEKPASDSPKSINKEFVDPDVESFVKRFESDSREVFAKRREIAAVLGLKPGMTAADVGAGTGFYSRLFARQVGPRGLVLAVDVSQPFLEHINETARKQGLENLRTVRASQKSTNLPADAVDRVIMVDVYHHLEDHQAVLASIRQALKPDGRFVLVEFDRREGKSSKFILEHVRADRKTFVREIEAAGFTEVEVPNAPELKENFIAVFERDDSTSGNGDQPKEPNR